MADQTDHFMREVRDEIRKERFAQIWDRFGVVLIAAAALLVIGVSVYQYMQYSSRAAREAAGVAFENAARLVRENKTQEAQQAFDAMVRTAPPGYGALAQLRKAGLLAEEGKRDEAVAAYDAVAKDAAADSLLRGYAGLRAATLQLDKADWTEMQNRLKDLTTDASAWRAPARELLGLAAMKAGHSEEARKAFEQILADSTAPPATAQRARILMAMLSEGTPDKPAPAAGEGTKPGDAAASK